ncbi:ADP-ribosyltransferase [Paenibacillus thiaminolyticus]|uniref:ADP-ribosyltransferase n=1 Tax=Paenibacillus thiaminolyticus TaxID=49283 RepID=UPI003D2B722E
MKKKFYCSLVLSLALASAAIGGNAAYAIGGAGSSNYYRYEVIDSRSVKDFKEDRKAAEKWGNKEYKAWNKKLNASEKELVKEYTGNAKPFNTYLRANEGKLGFKPDIDKKIVKLDEALKKSTVSETVLVYRGDDTSIFGKEFQNSLYQGNKVDRELFRKLRDQYQGKTKTEYGYLSTSLVSNQQFAMRPILTTLKVPKGAHAGYVDNISLYKGQYELLLPRNTKIRIDKMYIIVNKGSETIKIEATVLP